MLIAACSDEFSMRRPDLHKLKATKPDNEKLQMRVAPFKGQAVTPPPPPAAAQETTSQHYLASQFDPTQQQHQLYPPVGPERTFIAAVVSSDLSHVCCSFSGTRCVVGEVFGSPSDSIYSDISICSQHGISSRRAVHRSAGSAAELAVSSGAGAAHTTCRCAFLVISREL